MNHKPLSQEYIGPGVYKLADYTELHLAERKRSSHLSRGQEPNTYLTLFP